MRLTLTDYQVAEAFGDTVSLIYRDKMAEINEDLHPVMNFLDDLNSLKYTHFDRWFARQTLPTWAKQHLKAIDDMDKIKAMYKKMKKDPEHKERLNIEKARAVPITEIYDFQQKRPGQNVRCPFHPDKNPSASIKHGRLVCFQCGCRHDSISLFMALNKVSFSDAVTALSK